MEPSCTCVSCISSPSSSAAHTSTRKRETSALAVRMRCGLVALIRESHALRASRMRVRMGRWREIASWLRICARKKSLLCSGEERPRAARACSALAKRESSRSSAESST
eukprot:scaffold44854_cov33-Tisochrysis_lutea.AAC.4